MTQQRLGSRWIGGSLAILLALAQFRLIALLFRDAYPPAVDAAMGVLDGRPHWRLYQSRILSPLLVKALSTVFPSPLAAHVAVSIAMLAIAGYLAWRIGDRIDGRRGALTALFVLHTTFAFLLSRPWLYIWDYTDAVVFLLFVDFVLAARPWPWFAGLVMVAVLNHEVATFIALWLILDPVLRTALSWRGGQAVPLDRWRVAGGGACLVGSWLVVEGLRRALFVEAMGPKLFGGAPVNPDGSFHFRLWENLDLIGTILTRPDYSMPIVVLGFVVVAAALTCALARRDPDRFLGLAITHLALTGSLLTFGILLETRIWVVLIPIVVLGSVLLVGQDTPQTNEPRTRRVR